MNDQHVTTLVIEHETDQLAAENLTRLAKILDSETASNGMPWAEEIAVATSTLDGTLVIFTLVSPSDESLPHPSEVLQRALLSRDLFWVEPS